MDKIINWLDFFMAFLDLIVRVFIISTLFFIFNVYELFTTTMFLRFISLIFIIWCCIPILNLINLRNISKKLEHGKLNQSK